MSVVSQEGHDSEETEHLDWSVWAVAGDDGTSSVTSSFLSPVLGNEWMNWRVKDPDWESDDSV